MPASRLTAAAEVVAGMNVPWWIGMVTRLFAVRKYVSSFMNRSCVEAAVRA